MRIPQPSWLPSIVSRTSFSCNEDFIEALFDRFKQDFIHHTATFRGQAVRLKRHPMTDGKEEDFWHLIKGQNDTDVTKLNVFRCERVTWARTVIEAVPNELVLEWEERGRIHLLLDYGPYNYLVVIARRKDYLLLWTGRPVPRNEIEKLRERYKRAQKTDADPQSGTAS